jgi:hypothetical protein
MLAQVSAKWPIAMERDVLWSRRMAFVLACGASRGRNAAKNGHMAKIFNASDMGGVVVQAERAP